MPRENAKQNVPTLSASHFLWWNGVFGAKYQPAIAAIATAQDELTSLYEAIRDNRRDAVDTCVQRHPHMVFAKVCEKAIGDL